MYLGTKLLNNPIQKVKKWNFRDFFGGLWKCKKRIGGAIAPPTQCQRYKKETLANYSSLRFLLTR